MKRLFIFGLLTIFILLVATSPTLAASWEDKITGGGQAYAPVGCNFSITVSAWDDVDGNSAGNMEYSRDEISCPSLAPLSMHSKVECVGLFTGDVAVAAGPVWGQNDPNSLIKEGSWLVVNIMEGGVGSGDRVRVYFSSPTSALNA